MRSWPGIRRAPRAATAALALLTGGCGHMPAMHWPHWSLPWHRHPAPAAAPVHELDIGTAAGAPGGAGTASALPQYWKRNTLVVDLAAASGTGGITLTPAAGTTWPVRLAFRVTPGSIGILSVHGDQRLIIPVTPGAGGPVDLELAPGVYGPKTAAISVSWGPNNPPEP